MRYQLKIRMYIILGDFNTRVGSRGVDDDQWRRVRGPCGLGVVNEAGAELLNFLLLNETTICNKREIYTSKRGSIPRQKAGTVSTMS